LTISVEQKKTEGEYAALAADSLPAAAAETALVEMEGDWPLR
jgi:hypothetical protein